MRKLCFFIFCLFINLARPSVWANEQRQISIPIPHEPYDRLSQSPLFKVGEYPPFANLLPYQPQYPLFSDKAEKRRWIYLPASTKVETSSPDDWIFPQGTIVLKEFSLHGKKIETRLFEKKTEGVGFASWRVSVYIWRTNQTDADLMKVKDFLQMPPEKQGLYQAGLVKNEYKMMNLNSCQMCHGPAKDVVQGFSYLQLSDLTKPVNAMSLDDILTQRFLLADSLFGNTETQAAMGYMQSNCATCHSERGIGTFNAKHNSKALTIQDEPFMQALQQDPNLAVAKDKEHSKIYTRMVDGSMPMLRGVLRDDRGLELISNWIMSM